MNTKPAKVDQHHIGLSVHPHGPLYMTYTKRRPLSLFVIPKKDAKQRFVVLSGPACSAPCPPEYRDYSGVILGRNNGMCSTAALNWVLGCVPKPKAQFTCFHIRGGEFASCVFNLVDELRWVFRGYRAAACVPRAHRTNTMALFSMDLKSTIALDWDGKDDTRSKNTPSFAIDQFKKHEGSLWQLGLYLWHPGLTLFSQFLAKGKMTFMGGRLKDDGIRGPKEDVSVDQMEECGFKFEEWKPETLSSDHRARRKLQRATVKLVNRYPEAFSGLL